MNDRSTRILIVDDHPIVRCGIRLLLADQPDLEVVGEAGTAREALAETRRLEPDIMILDLSLGADTGLDVIGELAALQSPVRILVMSMHDETLHADRVLRSGAHGYIMKHEASDKVIAAIRQVQGGNVYLSPQMSRRLLNSLVGGHMDDDNPDTRLSERERQVFELLGEGFSTKEVATTLGVSIKTIETHRAHIKDKLHIRNASGLIQRAVAFVLQGA